MADRAIVRRRSRDCWARVTTAVPPRVCPSQLTEDAGW